MKAFAHPGRDPRGSSARQDAASTGAGGAGWQEMPAQAGSEGWDRALPAPSHQHRSPPQPAPCQGMMSLGGPSGVMTLSGELAVVV